MAVPSCIAECPALPEISGVGIRHVPNFPGYAAGDDGSIWSCCRGRKWKMMKPFLYNGYGGVYFQRNGELHRKRVSRVILETFVGPAPQEGMHAAHFPDQNPANNRLDNLSWKTAFENEKDKIPVGTRATGERHGNSRLCESDIIEIRRMKAEGATQREITDKFGITRWMVRDIVVRRRWKHVP